jgi:hypothetical protein
MKPLPSPGSGFWEGLFTGRIHPELDFLATKMLLDRLVRSYAKAPSVGTLQQCREELVSFLNKNEALPKIKSDIDSIVRSGGGA